MNDALAVNSVDLLIWLHEAQYGTYRVCDVRTDNAHLSKYQL